MLGLFLTIQILFDYKNVCVCYCSQQKRHKSKKGGIQKRVYFWGGICWHGKSAGVAWTASDMKVCFRHTKNLCVGTLFEDDGVVFRVVETRAANGNNKVVYCDHFRYPDEELPADARTYESWHHEVKEWHGVSRRFSTAAGPSTAKRHAGHR